MKQYLFVFALGLVRIFEETNGKKYSGGGGGYSGGGGAYKDRGGGSTSYPGSSSGGSGGGSGGGDPYYDSTDSNWEGGESPKFREQTYSQPWFVTQTYSDE